MDRQMTIRIDSKGLNRVKIESKKLNVYPPHFIRASINHMIENEPNINKIVNDYLIREQKKKIQIKIDKLEGEISCLDG